MKEYKIVKKEKGITLIALVVTIVVLLILAAVSISMLTGENGIIKQAQDAQNETTIAEEKETITLAISAIKTRLETIGKDNLKEEIEKIKGKESAEVTEVGSYLLEVKYKDTGNAYTVTKDGDLINLDTELNARYELQVETNELYIIPYIENIETILEVLEPEEWITSLVAQMSEEQKEKMFLDLINIGTGKSYETIDDLLVEMGYSSLDELLQNEFEGITNLDEFVYEIGYNEEVIIENPDGSLTLGKMEEPTQSGYPVEIGKTYTFKIRFMGLEIEKSIKAQDLSDWEWEVNEDGQTVTITSYKGNSTTVIVPDEIYGMKVTEIGLEKEDDDVVHYPVYKSIWNEEICRKATPGYGNVYWQESITEVILPEGIEKINNGAFSYANKLEKINIPNSVISIGEYAFYCCEQLKKIILPNGLSKIEEGIFESCNSLESINIPSSVTNIGEEAFYRSGITSITIPNSVTTIEWFAFGGCDSLTSINIPNSVINVGSDVFSFCSNLTVINIEATSIPETWDSDWKGDCTATVNLGVAMD